MKLIVEQKFFKSFIGKLVTEGIEVPSYEQTKNQFLGLIDKIIEVLPNYGMGQIEDTSLPNTLEVIVNNGYDAVLDMIMSDDSLREFTDYLDYYSRDENLANPKENLMDEVGFNYYVNNNNVMSTANQIVNTTQSLDAERADYEKSQLDYNL